jgi:hypothetical protein
MSDGWLELEQEILVFVVVLRFLDVNAGKGFNRLARFPQGEYQEVRFSALHATQDGYAAIAGDRLVIGDRPFDQELQILVGFDRIRPSVPCSCDLWLIQPVSCPRMS